MTSEPDRHSIQSLRGITGQPDQPVPVDDVMRTCAAVCMPPCEAQPVKVARVRFDPARGLLVGTFEDGVIMESADPCELAEGMFAHGARHGHVSMPDWREGDAAPAGGHRIAFNARLNQLGRVRAGT
ncbi:hypothetical protein [Paraburkholderia nemoris]|uniref:hypothetical protein n=1 Tax=Paraburkholderia nemoris TaxID=2793076 RepID=UPI0038BB8B5C